LVLTDKVLKVGNNYKSLLLETKALQSLNRFKEAKSTIKMAIDMKPCNSLLKELKQIEEKDYINETQQEKIKKANLFINDIHSSKKGVFLVKILRIILYNLRHLVRNNKLLFSLLCCLFIITLKDGISQSFNNVLKKSLF